MGSQPPYGSYPSSGQPWPEQPSEPAAPSYGQSGAYPPPPSYGAAPYPSQPGQAPYPPSQPLYGYAAPNIYVQPAAYVVAAPADPGSGPAVTSLVLGIVGTVSAVLVSWLVCLSFIPIILGIVGFIMGILGFKSKTRHGMAVAGFILSIIAVAIPIVIFIIYVVADAAMYATPQ